MLYRYLRNRKSASYVIRHDHWPARMGLSPKAQIRSTAPRRSSSNCSGESLGEQWSSSARCGFEPHLAQQPPNRANANFRAIVALAQMALALGAGDDAQPASAALQRVEEILPVHLAAARHGMDDDPGAIVLPLPPQGRALRDAAVADVHDHVG